MNLILFLLLIQIPSPRTETIPTHNSAADLSRLARIISLCEQHSIPDATRHIASDTINGMLQTLDPHSTFFDALAFQELKAGQSGTFTGIGIRVITYQSHIFVSEVKAGSPASSSGLGWGDEIISVNQKTVTPRNMESLISRIRGEIHTIVNLGIRKYSSGEQTHLRITRSEIQNTCIDVAFILPSKFQNPITGYIRLTEFGETSGEELRTSLTRLMKKGCNFLILDLRDNPGGLLQQAIECADLFLPADSIVVKTLGRYTSDIQTFNTSPDPPLFKGPLILLINQGSASAAEILAGALQDYDRALIMGSQSWGKGLVQSVFSIPPGETGLALTTARYTTPLGRNIQGDYNNLYDYLQPLSGERFFFRNKSDHDPHVTTLSGRLIFTSRGIGPDVFFADKNKIMAEKMLDYNQSLTLFIIANAQKKWIRSELFIEKFSGFFSVHNGFSIEGLLSTELKQALFLEYVTYMKTYILNQQPTPGDVLQYPVVQLALKGIPQAKALSSACFEQKHLPKSIIQSMFQLSVQAQSGQGDLN